MDLVISRFLFEHFPKVNEGELTKLRAEIVREKTLAQLAIKIGVGKYIRLGRGERKSKGEKRPSILADTLEALIGAIYIGQGIEITEKVIFSLFEENLNSLGKYRDYKTLLQEIVQGNRKFVKKIIEYKLISTTGPDHAPWFNVEVFIDNKFFSYGEGKNKKQAEQSAAAKALLFLEKNN